MGDRRGGQTPWRSFVPRGPIGILTCIALSAIAVVVLGGSLLVAALVVPLVVVCVMTAGHLFFNPFDEPLPGEPPAPPAGVREPRPPGGPPLWETGAAAHWTQGTRKGPAYLNIRHPRAGGSTHPPVFGLGGSADRPAPPVTVRSAKLRPWTMLS